ncbi:bifunctional ADP-dependent NAD(P)H-hydrate dehydratase/NAD(P)H-hydrate epimerase [Pelagimonas sp. KU-00592-HH]|uniref:NAD(P)H-hydrate dehydratase n=1 Tax=Pelagimonas sp. KU-00592-HH TaxID=3127651 RepID=UPI003102DA4A
MTEILTAAQMRAIEKAAIESGEVMGLELMERAGRGVVEAIFEEWPALAEEGGAAPHEAHDGPRSPRGIEAKKKRRAVVLCGPGNNGGDGFVVARLLKERGWEVEVFLYGDAGKLPPDARVNYERWLEMGSVRSFCTQTFEDESISKGGALVVDALFGTGLTRSVELPLVALSPEPALGSDYKLVSVDVPSGLCSDSGRQILNESPDQGGIAAPSDLTVSFHREKLGHRLADGPASCGKTVVADIGLEGWTRPRVGADGGCPAVPPGDIVTLVDGSNALLAKAGAHKFSHGHALILSGGAGKSGAARLAARGALRVGVGLVTLGVPHDAQAEVAAQITALMMCEIGDAGALAKTLEDGRLNALCLGPGLGLERVREFVPVALGAGANARRAVVLDADALSAFAGAPDALFGMLHENCVLTPHGGEFQRLFPDLHARLEEVPTKGPAYSKVDATREAAARAGCTVLFKGPDTVIAAPEGRCSVHSAAYERAAPWLATAGSGDVLAGFITGLLARGFSPMEAAETGAWLHVECARTFGPGLIAEDLPEMLPQVFRDLGL